MLIMVKRKRQSKSKFFDQISTTMIAITNVTLSCLVLVFIEFGFQNLNRTHFCPCRNNHIIRRFSRLKKFEITYSRITAHRRTVQKKSRILHCRERQYAT